MYGYYHATTVASSPLADFGLLPSPPADTADDSLYIPGKQVPEGRGSWEAEEAPRQGCVLLTSSLA